MILPCVVFFGGCVDDGRRNEYDKVTHNVAFYTGSEDTFNIPMQTVRHGDLVIRPPKPTKIDHTFVAWYKDLACTEIWKFESDIVDENITLYAKWLAILNEENTYTVTFYSGTNEVDVKDQVVSAGGLIIEPEAPTKRGYYFDGWFRNEELNIRWYFHKDVVDKNIILYAKWIKVDTD